MDDLQVTRFPLRTATWSIIIVALDGSAICFIIIIVNRLSASDFFSLLAKKISHYSGDERETAFFQRVSVLIQRFNGVLLHDSFVFEDCLE